MKKNFEFENIGKRMPYRMPEGFMQDMESRVLCEVKTAPHGDTHSSKTVQLHAAFRSLVAAAAVALLFIVSYDTMLRSESATSYEDVERAFDNLSYSTQSYMLDTYNNDVFMCQPGDVDY